MTDHDIENEIQEKGLTAKRVTLESINAAIKTSTITNRLVLS